MNQFRCVRFRNISKNESKSKKEEDKSIQQKIGTRVEQQRSFYVLYAMLVTRATFHAETSELKTMAPLNTTRTPQNHHRRTSHREERKNGKKEVNYSSDVCDFAISKNQSKSKKKKKINRSNKRLERVEQQRSFHVLAYMLVTLATFHAETSELKTMAPRNTTRTPQSPQKNITQREEGKNGKRK